MLASYFMIEPTWWCGMLHSTHLSVDGISWMAYRPQSDRHQSQACAFWMVVGLLRWTIWSVRVWSTVWSTTRGPVSSRTACLWTTMKPSPVQSGGLRASWKSRHRCSSAMIGASTSTPGAPGLWKAVCFCRTTMLRISVTATTLWAAPRLHRMGLRYVAAVPWSSGMFSSTEMTFPWSKQRAFCAMSLSWTTVWAWRQAARWGL